jgi:hypothetical protein
LASTVAGSGSTIFGVISGEIRVVGIRPPLASRA